MVLRGLKERVGHLRISRAQQPSWESWAEHRLHTRYEGHLQPVRVGIPWRQLISQPEIEGQIGAQTKIILSEKVVGGLMYLLVCLTAGLKNGEGSAKQEVC